MIEVLLEAERALTHGRLDEAERLYRQVVASDPKSAIAFVGLARVALERGDDLAAYLDARRALAIDPENPAAQHLVMRMSEVLAGRGEMPADAAASPLARMEPSPATEPPGSTASAEPTGQSKPTAQPKRKAGVIGRLLNRRIRRP